MLSTRIFGLACAVTVFACLMAAPVSARPLDKRTPFTFSGPVTLPGVTLPAGQYTVGFLVDGSGSMREGRERFIAAATAFAKASNSDDEMSALTFNEEARAALPSSMPFTSDAKHFKAGDRVWIVWSGVHDSSDAVRQVRRSETGRKIDEDLVLPAELVSTETPNQYLTIRIKVPQSGLDAIKTVKTGQWVTVTSRHKPLTDDDAVVAVRPYGASTITE